MAIQQASILINLDSRRARTAYSEVKQVCIEVGIEISKVYEMGKNSSIESTITSIKRANPPVLIIAGGDGTVSRSLGFLAGSDIEIGIVPLGTTNNFARSLGLPLTIEDSLRAIVANQARPVDLGKISQRHFANISGIGISALVAKSVSDKQKRRWGRFAYAVVGAKCLITHKPFHVTVTDKDHDLKLHFQTHQVIVANGRYHAGREIVEDARVNSHELIVFPIGGKSKINFIIKMIDFYIGKRKSVKHSSYLIARDIKIHTSHPQSSEVDGEIYKPTPLSFKVVTGAVKIRYGKVS